MRSVEEIVDAGNGVSVLNCGCIKLPKVDTEPETTVPLHHNHWRSPGTVGGTDDTAGEHLLHLCHLFSPDSRILAAIWLVKRWPLSLDRVL